MKNLISYKDGRLKTGRVAVLVFIGLLVCFAMLFKARKPVDQVLVRVSHVFEAEDQIKKPEKTKPIEQESLQATLPELKQEKTEKKNQPTTPVE